MTSRSCKYAIASSVVAEDGILRGIRRFRALHAPRREARRGGGELPHVLVPPRVSGFADARPGALRALARVSGADDGDHHEPRPFAACVHAGGAVE